MEILTSLIFPNLLKFLMKMNCLMKILDLNNLLLFLLRLTMLCSNIWRKARVISLCKKEMRLMTYFLCQPAILKHNLPVEDLGTTLPPKEDPVFDLKPLPDDVKYAYIDDKKIYHVIISSKLSGQEEERLLQVLQKHRGAMGYTLDDF